MTLDIRSNNEILEQIDENTSNQGSVGILSKHRFYCGTENSSGQHSNVIFGLDEDNRSSLELPSATNENLSITGENNSDSPATIYVEGYDVSGNFITESVIINTSNFQTPINMTNQFFRVTSAKYSSDQKVENTGKIYFFVTGSFVLSSGEPSNFSNVRFTIPEGAGTSRQCTFYIPPEANASLLFDKSSFNVMLSQRGQTIHKIQYKQANTDNTWFDYYRYYFGSRNVEAGYAGDVDLNIYPIPNTSLGIDVRILSSLDTSVNCSCSFRINCKNVDLSIYNNSI